MRTIWITDEPMPASEHAIEAATEPGASEIMHGVPSSFDPAELATELAADTDGEDA